MTRPIASLRALGLPAVLSLGLGAAAPAAPTQEGAEGSRTPPARVEARVTSAALFKNGLAVVRRRVTLPGPGSFEVGGVPEAVHGTLRILSSVPVEARTAVRELEHAAPARPGNDLQIDLAGCEVTLTLRAGGGPEVRGRVVDFPAPATPEVWSRDFEDPTGWNRGWPATLRPLAAAAAGPSRFLALDAEQGRMLIDTASIESLVLHGAPAPRRRTEQVLLLAAEGTTGPVEVELSYLCKGLSYAPSLHLDIEHPEVLAITQTAVLRNELEDLDDVELELISGFPSIEFSHVLSPFAPHATWTGFFRQLAQDPRATSGRGAVLSQQAASNVALYHDSLDPAALMATGEGVDLHHRSIGRRSLREGETLLVPVAEARAPYERIVEWRIPDNRNEWGQAVDRAARARQDVEEGPWDALRFANPFDSPLTTAPATIVAGKRFQGQRTSTWVNPGQETVLRVTKALSVRVRAAEHEAEAQRELIDWGGRRYRKVRVEGELWMANHRKETVPLLVRRELTGELDSSEESHRAQLLESGVYSVNRRQELVWSLSLAPGEERRLAYAYTVLVRH